MDPFNHADAQTQGSWQPQPQPRRRRQQQQQQHQQQQQQHPQMIMQNQGYPFANDNDDDHIPLSAITDQLNTYPQGVSQQPPSMPMAMAMNQQYMQQQYQQPLPFQQAQYSEPQHSAPTISYQQQLEIELEQQQQQFQQQFLHQYRLVQEQQQQYQNMGMDQSEWMHEGFAGHDGFSESPYALGFQSTPHNPNIYAQQAAVGHIAPHMNTHYAESAATDNHSRRHSHRPWVSGSGAGRKHNDDQSAAFANSDTHPHNFVEDAVHSDGESSSESSAESSATDSSDESIYKATAISKKIPVLEGLEAKPKKQIITSAVSRSPSVASSQKLGPSAKQPPKRHPSKHMHVAATSTPASVSASATASASASLASYGGTGRGSYSNSSSDTDDDVPLSVISSSSAPSSDALAAAVRRTKTAIPATFAARQRVPGADKDMPEAILRGAAKSRSLLVRPGGGVGQQSGSKKDNRACNMNQRNGSSAASSLSKPLDSKNAASISEAQNQPPSYKNNLVSNNGDSSDSDEDAPLDQLKAELEMGIRTAPDGQLDVEPDSLSADDGDSNSRGQMEPEANAVASSMTASASSSMSRAASSIRSFAGSLASRKTQNSSPAKEPPAAAKASNENSQVSTSPPLSDKCSLPLSSREGSIAEEASPKKSKLKTKRSSGYLPTGNTLPGLPVKQRSARARAAVQYVALADIVENTQRTPGAAFESDFEENAEVYDMADDGTGNANLNARRHKSVKRGNTGLVTDGIGDESGSIRSHFTTASSSADTVMDILRAGPVELLTASSERSGSKAVLDWVVPEDYGDIDLLLNDLEGIMSGSMAARKRFSLTLMRRSLAVDNGLVEPVDFSEQQHMDTSSCNVEEPQKSVIEFKPLEIAAIEGDSSSGPDVGGGLGLEDLIMSTLNIDNNDFANAQAEVPGKDFLRSTDPVGMSAAELANLGNLDSQLELEPLSMPPLKPVELTRSQKVQKALEKLEFLDVRKVSIRIYVQDAQRYYTFALTKYTTCEMILNDMKKSGIIDPEKSTWALFELVEHFGIERPLNHFENLMALVESWEPRSSNYIIVKGFAQQSSLTLLGGVQPGDHAIQGMLYYRIKKSKWQKGVFRLQGHNMIYVKDGRGKSVKEAHYLTLTNNDVYTPYEPLRGAPTRYVFGLKSEMPMQMFEKPDEDYVKWFAVQTLESLREWLQVFRLAKNQIKFRQVLETRVVETNAMKESNKDAHANKPLVDLAPDKQDDDDENNADGKKDFAADLVSSLSRVAANNRFDPSALVRIAEQGGIDVSDFKELAPGPSDAANDDNEDTQADENLFIPGSLLSKPRKTAIEARANQPPDMEMFAKGSLLSQPRESKALAASRAMQSIMAQDGNVFTQGSLLQVTEQTKPRPAHVGGAANLPQGQGPLVQMKDKSEYDPAIYSMPPQRPVIHSRGTKLLNYDEEPVFGGLMAGAFNQQPQHQKMAGFNMNGYQISQKY
ncbi:hypothetical protein FB645_004153 [Coemansia sp. IMI 203386]|nr:hypothetical protein FB645_004153 [Coemansia sp. IMI 203386]